MTLQITLFADDDFTQVLPPDSQGKVSISEISQAAALGTRIGALQELLFIQQNTPRAKGQPEVLLP